MMYQNYDAFFFAKNIYQHGCLSVIKYVSALHAEKNLESRHQEVKRNPCLYFFHMC